MFDDPHDIDCSQCKADLDESCVDEGGNKIVGFHVERINAITLWNRFIKTGDFDTPPMQKEDGADA
jgi:hypothetical protein